MHKNVPFILLKFRWCCHHCCCCSAISIIIIVFNLKRWITDTIFPLRSPFITYISAKNSVRPICSQNINEPKKEKKTREFFVNNCLDLLSAGWNPNELHMFGESGFDNDSIKYLYEEKHHISCARRHLSEKKRSPHRNLISFSRKQNGKSSAKCLLGYCLYFTEIYQP